MFLLIMQSTLSSVGAPLHRLEVVTNSYVVSCCCRQSLSTLGDYIYGTTIQPSSKSLRVVQLIMKAS